MFAPLALQAAIIEPISSLDAVQLMERVQTDCGSVDIQELRLAMPVFRKYHAQVARKRLMTAAWSCQQEMALISVQLAHASSDDERNELEMAAGELEMKKDYLKHQAEITY